MDPHLQGMVAVHALDADGERKNAILVAVAVAASVDNHTRKMVVVAPRNNNHHDEMREHRQQEEEEDVLYCNEILVEEACCMMDLRIEHEVLLRAQLFLMIFSPPALVMKAKVQWL